MSTLNSKKMCGGVSGKLWGNTQTVYADDNSEVALARIKKGGFCSLHTHQFKWNRFVVISGKLEIILDKGHCEDKIVLSSGMATDVPPGVPHKFVCLQDCICLEIYWIDALDLNDIKRKNNGGLMDLAGKEESPKRVPKKKAKKVAKKFPLRGQQDFLVMQAEKDDPFINPPSVKARDEVFEQLGFNDRPLE